MEKTATLNIRINPELKKSAEEVFSRLEIPMSVAVSMFFRQVVYTQKIPFELTVPMAPPELNADLMTREELEAAIMEGIRAMESGDGMEASEFFKEIEEKHKGIA